MVYNGTISLSVGGQQVVESLQNYFQDARNVMDGLKGQVTEGVPPHTLLDIVADDPANQSLLGKVLLTQTLIEMAPMLCFRM